MTSGITIFFCNCRGALVSSKIFICSKGSLQIKSNSFAMAEEHFCLLQKIFIHSKGSIQITPTSSLVSDRVYVRGTGYSPLSPITVKAHAHCEPERLSFTSYAHLLTCEKGNFDMRTSKSVGGTYTGVDDMGLFWSMESDPGYINRFQTNNASTPVQYDFYVFDGHNVGVSNEDLALCSSSIERLFLSKDVCRQEIVDPPFHATLFTPPGEGPFPAVITIYGGLKQGRLIEDTAALLANNGFVTLALAFYGQEGLPKTYVNEPLKLEFFEDAIEYLKSLNCVISDAIGVYGLSKGGEIAFTMASLLEDVKAAVAVNSFLYVLGAPTTFRDIVIPDGSYDLTRTSKRPDGTIVGKNAIYDCQDRLPSVIPIERSDADLLFVAGDDDHGTPSVEHAEFAAKKMLAAGKSNLEILKLRGVGHLVDVPFAPPCTISHHVVGPGKYYYGGEDKQLHCSQVVEGWNRIISFYCEKLKEVNCRAPILSKI